MVSPAAFHSKFFEAAKNESFHSLLESESDSREIGGLAMAATKRDATALSFSKEADVSGFTGYGTDCLLTLRELEILHLITCGFDDVSIARTVHLSLHGVKKKVRSILQKLEVRNRTEAAVLGLLTGLCDPSSHYGTNKFTDKEPTLHGPLRLDAIGRSNK